MLDPLLVDLYPFDLNGKPDLGRLVAAGLPWAGVWLKTSQGLYYPNPKSTVPQYTGQWFKTYWQIAKQVAGARHGVDWFRGCYHYADLKQDPLKQAAFFLSLVDAAGGWSDGDLPPFLDVEASGNPDEPGEPVIDQWMHAFSLEIVKLHGRKPICYGGSYLRDNSVDEISDDYPYITVAAYGSELAPKIYQRIGYKYGGTGPGSLFGWQYRGTDDPGKPPQTSFPKGYPSMSPLSPKTAVDITAVVVGGGAEKALEVMRTISKLPAAPAPIGGCS